MSLKLIKGARQKGNDSGPDIVQYHSTVKNSVVFHSVSKSSPVLSDRSEFPSLNESSEKELSNSHSEKILKYSDKLKSFSNNQDIACDECHSQNVGTSDTLNQHKDRTYIPKNSKKWNPIEDNGNFNKKGKKQNTNQDSFDKLRFVNSNKMHVNLSQNVSKTQLNQSTKECSSSNQQVPYVHQKEFSKEKPVELSLNSKSCALFTNSANINLNSSSINQTKCNKSAKLIAEKNELKEDSTSDMHNNTKEKKKKKRKSKAKRQVALQSGKITVLTPEVHLKILNQTKAITSSINKSVLTDINDEEEYPELGKPLFQTNQKGSNSKKSVFVESSRETVCQSDESCTENKISDTRDNKDSLVSDISEKPVSEKKGKCDNKVIVHPKDPISISFCDIILNKNSKPKDGHDEIHILDTVGLAKVKIKKDTSRPHNLLDSSSPVVKRGKEREKPKPKKPSQLKKIILFDRKTRKEQLLNLKASNPMENSFGVELENKLNKEKLDNEVDVKKLNCPAENNSYELENITDQTLLLSPDNSDTSSNQEEETVKQMPIVLINNESNIQNKFVPEMKQFSLSENHSEEKDLSFANAVNQDVNPKNCLNISDLSLNKMHKNGNDNSVIFPEKIQMVSASNVSYSDSLLNSLLNNVKRSEASDKEKAAKILLHTRNFREYCNHLISKDIDDAVFSLLDDLARFQDRLHQKDPVKARMKRRMINGIKEVKKHIKLRKLKCIVIAVDIENVETQGGLNDILNDIKVSAAEHHIPCIFALSRKVLGKVCRKPVPISCVGVLNFEGSEVNFKKMVELQTQSKTDYNEIFSKLTLKLTDEEASALLKAKTEAPETLRAIRTDILNDFFMKSKTGTNENENKNVKSDQISDFINTET